MRSGAPILGLVAATALCSACATTTTVVAEQFHLPPGGDAAAGKQAFVDFGCARCHRVHGRDDLPAPTVEPEVPFVLSAPAPSRITDARLVTAIIHPGHQVTEAWKAEVHDNDDGSRMRPYNDRMTVQDLLDIVAFLRSAEAT